MKALSCYLFFDVFASKTRMSIIKTLWNRERSVQEICKITGIEQSNISHQLRKLQRCHIVKAKGSGKKRLYSLENSVKPIINAAEKHLKRYCKRRCQDWQKRNK